MPNLEERKAELYKLADALTEDTEFVCFAVRDNENTEDDDHRTATKLINATLLTIVNGFCNIIKSALVHEMKSGAFCMAFAKGVQNAILRACADAASELFANMTPEEQCAELKSLLAATGELIDSMADNEAGNEPDAADE